MPPSLLDLAEAQEGLLSTEQCGRHGVGASRCSRAVAGGRWSRVTRGVVDTITVPPASRTAFDVPRSPVPPLSVTSAPDLVPWPPRSDGDRLFGHLRRRAGWLGHLAHGATSIPVGTSALAFLGIEGTPVTAAPDVALPWAAKRQPRAGVPLRQFDDGLTTVPFGDGRTGEIRIAAPEWALAQAVPELTMERGLAVLDSARRLRLVDRHGVERSHDHARGRRGVAARHDLWDLADPRAASPLESFARWQCIAEGVPPDTLQLVVRDLAGAPFAVGDLAWRLGPTQWLVGELDGYEWHDGDPARVVRDRDRDNAFTALGVRLLRFDAGHLRRGEVGTAVRRALHAYRRTGG
ncbi:hypothetical protein LEP48_05225 [Isoptericola sp. NEAU-Y5]|uniref:AbiEi antitoxin N-terminal domain-containing protein n=1 Tax=Isoptericola luteus TaxID=2879484 RepID=A0ABS7ZCH5_9MICO|nr:type IV toxin-antitoxin system AbiEi family antitoxin domain-containing protein [Isoptericola sp. NEAU-Y5]MCA5892754.1 hypothetical protein [Isoptericola sp. NEAU-Y5]